MTVKKRKKKGKRKRKRNYVEIEGEIHGLMSRQAGRAGFEGNC